MYVRNNPNVEMTSIGQFSDIFTIPATPRGAGQGSQEGTCFTTMTAEMAGTLSRLVVHGGMKWYDVFPVRTTMFANNSFVNTEPIAT